MAYDHTTTADQVLQGFDLAGKQVIVTGASGGVGEETARALASKGAAVTLASRNKNKLDEAANRIRESTGSKLVETGVLDLAKPDSVRAFAADWMESHGQLNILINNAGVMACPLSRTADGWEMHFASNYLGHFLLTCLLVPALKAGAPARVVNLSSRGHRRAAVDLDDPNFDNREYDAWVGYGQSKTANIWFSNELNKRLSSTGITSNALHPGVIITDLYRHMTRELIKEQQDRYPHYREDQLQMKTVPAGAATSVWAATSPELEGKGGLFLEDCGISGPMQGEDDPHGYAPHAMDQNSAGRLWNLAEELLGETFDLS